MCRFSENFREQLLSSEFVNLGINYDHQKILGPLVAGLGVRKCALFWKFWVKNWFSEDFQEQLLSGKFSNLEINYDHQKNLGPLVAGLEVRKRSYFWNFSSQKTDFQNMYLY